jgi:hypothetical protein
MSARRREKKRRVFQTPVGQRFGDVLLLVLVIPIASAAAALLVVAGAVGVASRLGVELEGIGVVGLAGAVVVLVLVFRFRGWPAWTLELEEDGAVLGPFPRPRVLYEDITFIAAGTRRGWTGHHEDAEAYPLRVETRSGRVMTLRLKDSHADKALLALHEQARNATALDAGGEGEWGAAFGALLIGAAGAWAFGTAWWRALGRMRGHRRRVQQARAALRQTGQLPEA